MDKKIQQTNLLLLDNDLNGNLQLNGMPKRGTTYKKAGSVAYMFIGKEVKVTLRENDICTQVCLTLMIK